jgi:transposase InsO family protein
MKANTIHPNARTTPKIREEIQRTPHGVSARKLARYHHVNRSTIKRWRVRAATVDKSSAPLRHNFRKWTLENEVEIIAVRRQTNLSLDDLCDKIKADLGLGMSRAQVSRLLARNQLTCRTKPKIKIKPKKFAKTPLGYLHIDTTYLIKINGVYWKALVAIERNSRWCHIKIVPKKTAAEVELFARETIAAAPFKVHTALTDNGTEFTHRCLWRKTNKVHPLDKVCAEFGIRHKLTQPCHPWTNGMVERHNRRIKENTLYKTRYASIEEMKNDLYSYRDRYNLSPRRLLNGLSPLQSAASLAPTS